MAVAVEFDFDVKEHRRALRAVQPRTVVQWSPRVGALILLAVGALLATSAVGNGASYREAAIATSPVLFIAFLFGVLLPWLRWWSVRRLLNGDPSIRGLQRREVSSSGFRTSGNGVAVDLPWHAMAQVLETEEFFLFYYTKAFAYYLGKARLTPDQQAEVRDLMSKAAAL